MQGDIEIGGDQGNGTPFPTRYLVIGGAAVLMAAAFMYLKGRGAPSSSATDTTGAIAGTDTALAIGSLESRLKESSGALEQLIGQQSGHIDDLFSAQATKLDDLLGSQSAAFSQLFGSIHESDKQTLALNTYILNQLRKIQQPGHDQQFEDEYFRWVADTFHIDVSRYLSDPGSVDHAPV